MYPRSIRKEILELGYKAGMQLCDIVKINILIYK